MAIHARIPQEAKKPAPTKPKMVDHDAPSGGLITDHKYAPMGEWWTRCRYCKLAQAAHAVSELEYYGDNNYGDTL